MGKEKRKRGRTNARLRVGRVKEEKERKKRIKEDRKQRK